MFTPEETEILKELKDIASMMHDMSIAALKLSNEKKELISKHNKQRDSNGETVDPRYMDRNLAVLNAARQSYLAESTTYQKCEEALNDFINKYDFPF